MARRSTLTGLMAVVASLAEGLYLSRVDVLVFAWPSLYSGKVKY